MNEPADPRAAFIEACVWHGSLDRANVILTAHPEIASSDIYTAALLGDDAAVRRYLALDPANAWSTAAGNPPFSPTYFSDALIFARYAAAFCRICAAFRVSILASRTTGLPFTITSRTSSAFRAYTICEIGS